MDAIATYLQVLDVCGGYNPHITLLWIVRLAVVVTKFNPVCQATVGLEPGKEAGEGRVGCLHPGVAEDASCQCDGDRENKGALQRHLVGAD